MAKTTLESKSGKYSDIDTWNKRGQLKDGDVLEGYLFDRDSFTTKYGTMSIYIVRKLDGELVKVIGHTNIKSKIDESVPLGVRIWFTYKGIVETKNGVMANYQIDIDPEDVIEVA